jgi:hypothetical protein
MMKGDRAMTAIRVRDLHPNPYRNLNHYPIDRDKVDALKRSIKDTTFWDNLLARRRPDDGGYEIAYGHHRLAALKEARVEEINIPVRSLDNTMMARIMAHENMEEWGHSAAIEQETVRAIVEAYGKGEIELPKPGRDAPRARLRYAPSFLLGVDVRQPVAERLYTVDTLADFLGWKHHKVEFALRALELMEKGLAKSETFKGLSSTQAGIAARQGHRILSETKDAKRAKAVVEGLASGMRHATGKRTAADGSRRSLQDVTVHNAVRQANRMAGTNLGRPVERKIPNIEGFTDALIERLARFFDDNKEKWNAVIRFREHLPAGKRTRLASAFRRAARDFGELADRLEKE